jgi:hypothetical protein
MTAGPAPVQVPKSRGTVQRIHEVQVIFTMACGVAQLRVLVDSSLSFPVQARALAAPGLGSHLRACMGCFQ